MYALLLAVCVSGDPPPAILKGSPEAHRAIAESQRAADEAAQRRKEERLRQEAEFGDERPVYRAGWVWDSDHSQGAYVQMKAGKDRLTCYFPEETGDRVASLERGQLVRIKGTWVRTAVLSKGERYITWEKCSLTLPDEARHDRPAPPPAVPTHQGNKTVHVQGYWRNGHWVNSYDRAPPGQGTKPANR